MAESDDVSKIMFYCYGPEVTFYLSDKDHKHGTLTVGDWSSNNGRPEVNAKEMSFVFEIVKFEGYLDPWEEDAIGLKESSASLLTKVKSIFGSGRIRDLTVAEQEQINKLKNSPQTSQQLKLVYENGKALFQSDISTIHDLTISRKSTSLFFEATSQNLKDQKSATITGFEGQSFVFEDAPGTGSCGGSLPSGVRAVCSEGTIGDSIW